VSSLRPLATIALLAAVGVFLYMKINQTEPKLSPDLEEWSTSSVQVDESVEVTAAATSPTSAPAAGGSAPPFMSAALTPPAAGGSSNEAPPWTPGTLEVDRVEAAPETADETEEAIDSSPVARTAETPDIPSMPPLPGAAADGAQDPTGDDVTGDESAPEPPPYGAPPPDLETPPPPMITPQSSMFAAARVAVQGALDRGELAQALLLLTDWYGDPSLTPEETKEVNTLLSQLAGSVIYEGPPAHRLLPAHQVQVGETLEAIANKYEVPWQLLAKINGIADPSALTPGQELKVVPGPFSATIDLSERKMTLMVDRRYAGQFALEFEPSAAIEEGDWKVDQKLVTPTSASLYVAPTGPAEDRSLLLANLANPTGPAAVLRGPGNPVPASAESRSRTLRLKAADVEDVFDILSVGSRVTIRR
jgi:LysM repeat protein